MGLSRIASSILFATALAACSGTDPGATSIRATIEPTGDVQTAYRIRSDPDASLNAEGGWAAPLNKSATVLADQPFRIRFEIEAGEETAPRVFRLQYRRNGEPWQALPAEDFPYPLKINERSAGAEDREIELDWVFAEHSATMERVQDATGPALRIEAESDAVLAWVSTDIDWSPVEYSIELRLDGRSKGGIGLVFEDQGKGDHAFIELLPPNRARALLSQGEQLEILAETTAEIPVGRWVEMKIEQGGSTWRAELDERTLLEWPQLSTREATRRPGIRLASETSVDVKTVTIEGEARTPRTSIISSSTFANGAPTEDRLNGSDLPFAGGAGVSLRSQTSPWSATRQHGEWEIPMVIRRFSDEAAINEGGDVFEFRLVDSVGNPLPAKTLAQVRLAIPEGHLGGTFVETPMRLGPWQTGTGDLFFIMEPSETWNRPMMVRSEDGGRSWREADGEGRPSTGDLEGVATAYAGGRIHVLHQISEQVLYHAFDPYQDSGTWVVRDEPVAAPPTPPTQVADLAVRTDGSIVAVYGAGPGLRYSVRSPEGDWDTGHEVAGPAGTVLSGPTLVPGRDDVVHLANTASDGTAWVRRIHPELGASEAIQVADSLGREESDVGALLPLVTLDEGRVLVLIHRARDGRLYERRSSDNGSWSEPTMVSDRIVIQSAVDSDQVGADVVTDGEALHVLFIEAGTGVLFHVVGVDGHWSAPRAVVTGVSVQWVRGQVLQSDEGLRSYGFVYDAGSNGGSGRNRFLRIPLQSAADPSRTE